jgi:hypothetical protein
LSQSVTFWPHQQQQLTPICNVTFKYSRLLSFPAVILKCWSTCLSLSTPCFLYAGPFSPGEPNWKVRQFSDRKHVRGNLLEHYTYLILVANATDSVNVKVSSEMIFLTMNTTFHAHSV